MLGRNTLQQFKGHRFDKRSGLPWKEVYNIAIVEREAAKMPATTFATIEHAEEAKRFKKKSRVVGELSNIFTDTDYGKRVMRRKGEFVIPSGHDLFRFTYGTRDNIADFGAREEHIGKIVGASPKPANELTNLKRLRNEKIGCRKNRDFLVREWESKQRSLG